MGPLYHLVSSNERAVALSGCVRALKPGGNLLASFISPYRPIFEALSQSPPDVDRVEQLLANGEYIFEGMQQWRCWPSQARELLEAGGLEVTRVRNTQGVGMVLAAADTELPTSAADKKCFLEILRSTCELPDVLGATWNFVCLCTKR